ncbi:MAG: hypothetical protein RLZZ324_739 [Candidatus Parcubacteria bacterium]
MSQVSCTHITVVTDESVRSKLWDVYCAAFGADDAVCIQEQLCYSKEEFETALLDVEYRKFIVADNGEPVGFFLCTNNLEKARVAYVNPKRLLAQFPEYAGRIYYFTAIAIRPDCQGRRFTGPLVVASTSYMDEMNALVAFDFSPEKNGALPDFLVRGMQSVQARFGLTTDTSTYIPMGGQQYGVIKMSKNQP